MAQGTAGAVMIEMTLAEARRYGRPLVYGLCAAGDIFYVGQTRNPGKRFGEHSRGKNNRLRQRLAELGDHVRVVVLADNPPDLNLAERAAIAAHADTIVNLIGAGSDVWSKHSDVPWAAGTGIQCPSTYGLTRTAPALRPRVRRALRAMSDADRCRLELRLLMDYPPYLTARHSRWLQVCGDKLIACINAEMKSKEIQNAARR
jgi:hypothetical protein